MNCRVILLVLLIVAGSMLAGQSRCLKGIVMDDEKEVLPFATVQFFIAGEFYMGVATDLDGYFILCNLPDSGLVDAQVDYTGYNPLEVENIPVSQDSIIFEMNSGGAGPCIMYTPLYRIPLVEMDNTTSGQTFTSDQIRRQPSVGYDYAAAERRRAKRNERRERRRECKAARRSGGSD